MAGLKDFATPNNGQAIRDRYQTLVGIKDDNSPLMNKSSLNEPIPAQPFSNRSTNIGTSDSVNFISIDNNPYFTAGEGINSDDNAFVINGEAKYNGIRFGTNSYFGSNKDDEVGGIFNGPNDKYSLTFGKINTPTLEQIVTQGNQATREGFPAKATIVDLVNEKNTEVPTRYFENGQISIAGTNITNRATDVEGVAITNPFVNASIVNNLAKRQIPINPNLDPLRLGEGDLANSQLAVKFKNLLDPRRGNSGQRGDEPYQLFDTDGRTNADIPLVGGNIGQSNNRGFALDSTRIDASRINKFLKSPAGGLRLQRQAGLRLQSVVVSAEYNRRGGRLNRVKTKKLSLGPENAVVESLAFVPGILGTPFGASVIQDRGILGAINLINTAKAELQGIIPPFDNAPDSISNLKGLHRNYESKVTNTSVGLPAKTVSDSFLPRNPKSFLDNFTDIVRPRDEYDPEGDPITTRAGRIREAGIAEQSAAEAARSLFDRVTGRGGNTTDSAAFRVSQEFNKDDGSIGALRTKEIINENYGAPFYFKDLRDNSIIVFRAYISSLNENVSPRWTDNSFIGRSEPTYIYNNASRDLSFTLKLHAGTSFELDAIYKKLNRLTSLCYPQYVNDKKIGAVRMKPPLTKFRYGDLYNSDFGIAQQQQLFTGLTGFIDSINYTFPDGGTWEIENGKQVPKLIEAALKYKVIHDQPPNINTRFYGYNPIAGE